MSLRRPIKDISVSGYVLAGVLIKLLKLSQVQPLQDQEGAVYLSARWSRDSRIDSNQIRCNKAHPRCDKCEATDAECVYLPRKARDKKKSSEKDILSNVLRRLERLEKHCLPDRLGEEDDDALSWRSGSVFYSDNAESNSLITQGATFSHSGEHGTKSQQFHDLLYQMRYAGPNLMEDETFSRAVEATMREIESSATIPQDCQSTDFPPIPKDMTQRWVNIALDAFQFEGFQNPLGRDFMSSIPDLLEIRHVQLDKTCLMIFYGCVIQGLLVDPNPIYERGTVTQQLYEKCADLLRKWRQEAQNNYTDFYAAFTMISLALEGCDVELSWDIFRLACKIAEALGYFTIDKNTPEGHDNRTDESPQNESFTSKNRKRYEFWYLLQVDCLFRLYFGRPASISEGSWVVNFPDPTISGVDDVSTHFIQIHFLASMRFTLVLLKYLDLVTNESTFHPVEYDKALDKLAVEVKSIMSNWKAEDLLESSTTISDTWFSADILFNGNKILIILQSSKKCNQQNRSVPPESVDIARVSITKMRSIINTAPGIYWGTSPILLHQFIPFLVLCSNAVGSREQGVNGVDLALITWASDCLGQETEGQVHSSPIRRFMKAMAGACQQIALGDH